MRDDLVKRYCNNGYIRIITLRVKLALTHYLPIAAVHQMRFETLRKVFESTILEELSRLICLELAVKKVSG